MPRSGPCCERSWWDAVGVAPAARSARAADCGWGWPGLRMRVSDSQACSYGGHGSSASSAPAGSRLAGCQPACMVQSCVCVCVCVCLRVCLRVCIMFGTRVCLVWLCVGKLHGACLVSLTRQSEQVAGGRRVTVLAGRLLGQLVMG